MRSVTILCSGQLEKTQSIHREEAVGVRTIGSRLPTSDLETKLHCVNKCHHSDDRMNGFEGAASSFVLNTIRLQQIQGMR